jgi:cystathionine beta-lyase
MTSDARSRPGGEDAHVTGGHVDLSVPDLAVLHRRRSEKWATHAPDVLSSTIAEMDFPIAEPVTAALHAAVARHDLGYATAAPPRLREAFAAFAARRLGWTVDTEQVTLVPDVMVGLIELCRVLAPAGGTVAFATPAYPPFLAELPPVAPVREIPLLPGGAGFDVEALRDALRAGTQVLVIANPHNPTGRLAPRRELEAIAEACAEHDAWVLADEIHAPIVVGDAAHTPWLEVSDAARWCGVALTSASKAFNLAALKAALVVTASPRARDAVARLPPMRDHVGLLGVVAAEAAFADGDAWLDAVLAQLRENRRLLGEALADALPAVGYAAPDATYVAWLDCRALGLGDDPTRRFLDVGRVALSRGLDYGDVGAGFVRLNFGTSPGLVTDTVRRMAAAAMPSGP